MGNGHAWSILSSYTPLLYLQKERRSPEPAEWIREDIGTRSTRRGMYWDVQKKSCGGKRKEKEGQPGLEIRNNRHRQQHRQLLEGGERWRSERDWGTVILCRWLVLNDLLLSNSLSLSLLFLFYFFATLSEITNTRGKRTAVINPERMARVHRAQCISNIILQ